MVSVGWLAALAACVGADGWSPATPGADTAAADAVDAPACSPDATLELVPLDAWGRDLAGVTVRWDHVPTEARTRDDGPGVVRIPFGKVPVTLRGRLEAAEATAASLEVRYDGAGTFDVDVQGAAGWRTGRDSRDDGHGGTCPTTSLYVLTDHPWFASQGAAPSRNRVELHADGESHWARVADDLSLTTRRVTWSTWWWQSAFELRRGPTDSARSASRVLDLLDGLPQVERRILVNRFWAENADWTTVLNTDPALLARATAPDDAFEVMLQGNDVAVPVYGEYGGTPSPVDFSARVRANPRYADRALDPAPLRRPVALTLDAASWHQKAMVFDGTVAWVTGMNTKQTDWDTPEHLVYDPHRLDPGAPAYRREEVRAHEVLPDNPPRRDYGMRLEGPAARDVEAVLQARWDAGLAAGDMYADRATAFVLDPPMPEPSDGVAVQVVATMPPPWSEMSILETHAKAVRQARRYLYIEDQYFRAPRLLQVIVQAMDENPELVLIVVTQPVGAAEGGAKYTYLADATLRARFPGRYLLLQLRSADLRFDAGWGTDEVELVAQDVFLHSKLRLVDDRYLSVGSCNMNNRGYLYEGELDVAVLDAGVARDTRRDVFMRLVGPAWAPLLSDDAHNNLDVLAMAAASNAEILSWWEVNAGSMDAATARAVWAERHPSGFVLPLRIEDDYAWDVGPDAF